MAADRRRFQIERFAALGIPVASLATDSRLVRPGDVFLAVPGERHDARHFIPQALAAGAAAVIWEPHGFAWDPQWRVPNIAVENLRAQLGDIAAAVYGDASRELWVAGVTGTNGKTSCTHWIAQALGHAGRRTGIVGTLGNGFPGALRTSAHTTPDAVAVQRELALLKRAGAECVAIEVSSHALEQGRVDAVAFDTALFTNLSRDHLDYHGTMERYGAAKARLFHRAGLRAAVVNLDDHFGAELAASLDRARVGVLGYGFGKGEISGHKLDLSARGLTLEIETPWGPSVIRSQHVLGAFNAANLMGVLGVLLVGGVRIDAAAASLAKVQPVPGRLQQLRVVGRPLVVVDYAHSPDALGKVLSTLRELSPDTRLICVFGCGGERDRGKRPLMGEIATRLADRSIVTSDNPRGEDPNGIIAEIVAGAHPNYEVEPDRATAIRRAVREARSDDIVLVAGKGHESYQEVAGVRVPFSDVDAALAALQGQD